MSGDTASSFEALLRVVFLGAMLFVFAGGGIGLLILWYMRGRDPRTGIIAEFLPEPPDDLPPGAAGTLLDEHADHHDIVATLLGLARHGAVEIVQLVPDSKDRRRPRRHVPGDYELILLDPAKCESDLEAELLLIIFGPGAKPGALARLSDIKPAFVEAEPVVRDLLYAELVTRGYFRRSPRGTRRRWQVLGWAGLVASLLLGLVLAVAVDVFALFPTIAAVVLWGAMIRLSKALPRKTVSGAEAAAKWRAFRRYLSEIERYENVGKARELFDRYLSYAVAFGLDREWIRTFAAVGAARPGWYHETGDVFVPGDLGDAGNLGDLGDIIAMGHMLDMVGHSGGSLGELPGLPNVDLPGSPGMPDFGGFDPQGMADVAGGSLQDVSDGLGGLLDSAGSVFDAIDF